MQTTVAQPTDESAEIERVERLLAALAGLVDAIEADPTLAGPRTDEQLTDEQREALGEAKAAIVETWSQRRVPQPPRRLLRCRTVRLVRRTPRASRRARVVARRTAAKPGADPEPEPDSRRHLLSSGEVPR